MGLAFRKKLSGLLFFHAAWGIVLWLSISKYGLGVSTDASAYLFAARNFSQGKSLAIYDGSAYSLWPPLYPMLVGAVQMVSGQNPFVAAQLVQWMAFSLLAIFSSLLFLKIFPHNFALAFLAAWMLDTAPVMISAFHMIGSDYLFALFPVLLAWLIGRYEEGKQSGTLALLIGLTAALGMLLRYIGYTLVLLGLWAVYRTKGISWGTRLWRGLWTGVWAIAPMVWMLNTWLSSQEQRRAPLAISDYLRQFAVGIMDWFFAPPPLKEVPDGWVIGLLGFLATSGLLWLALAKREILFTPYTWPVVAYGVIYTLALFGQASIAYFNRLWGRFLLPIYLPLLVMWLLLFQRGLRHLTQQGAGPKARLAKGVGLLLLLTLALAQTLRGIERLKNARQGIIPENIYNTSEWAENTILEYWQTHPPTGEYVLLSNLPAGVAFHTWHETLPSPRKRAIYGTEIIPLETYRTQIFADHKPRYLIWIEPNPYEHVYLPGELSPLALVETIVENEDGGIYRLRQR
jgi:hypothetical protein